MEGGADACLYMGPKITKRFSAEVRFGSRTGYRFVLEPTPDNRMVFADEATIVHGGIFDPLESGHAEAKVKDLRNVPGKSGEDHSIPYYVYRALSSWVVYHFHDTSLTAGVRRQEPVNVNDVLLPTPRILRRFSTGYARQILGTISRFVTWSG